MHDAMEVRFGRRRGHPVRYQDNHRERIGHYPQAGGATASQRRDNPPLLQATHRRA